MSVFHLFQENEIHIHNLRLIHNKGDIIFDNTMSLTNDQ